MKTILLVEDDKMLSDVLSHSLIEHKYNVITAGDGIEGLDAARDHHPDLILLDIMMPRLDGLEMLKQLRAQEDPGKRTHVIVLSSIDQPDQKVQAYANLVDDYIVKANTDPKQIVEKVTKIVYS